MHGRRRKQQFSVDVHGFVVCETTLLEPLRARRTSTARPTAGTIEHSHLQDTLAASAFPGRRETSGVRAASRHLCAIDFIFLHDIFTDRSELMEGDSDGRDVRRLDA